MRKGYKQKQKEQEDKIAQYQEEDKAADRQAKHQREMLYEQYCTSEVPKPPIHRHNCSVEMLQAQYMQPKVSHFARAVGHKAILILVVGEKEKSVEQFLLQDHKLVEYLVQQHTVGQNLPPPRHCWR